MRAGVILKALAGSLVLATLAGCGVTRLISGTPAEQSLAKIQVQGFNKTGQQNQDDPGGTVATGAYIGSVINRSRVGRLIGGPGVRVQMFSANSNLPGNTPGTIWVGKGIAPRGCKMEVEIFLRNSRPYSWYNLATGQLGQIRSGRRILLLVSAVCGTG